MPDSTYPRGRYESSRDLTPDRAQTGYDSESCLTNENCSVYDLSGGESHTV